MQLAQVQAQGGKAKAAAGPKAKAAVASTGGSGGTKRKQSAASLGDNSSVSNGTHSEKGIVRPRPAYPPCP
jgi:hypothetical protein